MIQSSSALLRNIRINEQCENCDVTSALIINLGSNVTINLNSPYQSCQLFTKMADTKIKTNYIINAYNERFYTVSTILQKVLPCLSWTVFSIINISLEDNSTVHRNSVLFSINWIQRLLPDFKNVLLTA